MSGPVRGPWWTRPAIVLPGIVALVTLVVLFAPTRTSPRSGDPRLSSFSTTPLGARLLHDLAQRTDWRTERRLRAGISGGSGTILAVLAPSIPLRATETHALLEHVRRGGAALVVLNGATQALMDSLHLRIGTAGPAVAVAEMERSCSAPDVESRATSLWFGQTPQMRTLLWTAPTPADFKHFLDVALPRQKSRPAVVHASMAGFALGEGRIVVAADPDVFRNDAMRECAPGFDVAAIRALEYLRDGGSAPRTVLQFDEYHQGHGAHPGSLGAAMVYLAGSPSGRLLAQLTLAGAILLIALAPRLVPPRQETRVERRSPLEQVEALARAYEQVRATRTASERLVRGLRRRVERGAVRERHVLDDSAWIARLGSRAPALTEEIALVQRALSDGLTPKAFATLGPALHRLETTLTRSS